MESNILKGVSEYYSSAIKKFGNEARGVDWNSKESQYLRFEQLCKVIVGTKFSLLDYGCGYGELINYLEGCKYNVDYIGYDISKDMLKEAASLFASRDNIRFINSPDPQKVDFVIASGVFNVRLNLADDNDWYDYILNTLMDFDQRAIKGFAFNALTKYSDKEYMKEYLYYADPLSIFDYCKKKFSRNVALIHDYNLYEFTIIVRKNG